MKVLKMSAALFQFRRRIIGFLYEAKAVIGTDLPRIKVRIVNFGDDSKALGRCYIARDYVVISHKCADWSDAALRSLVWHELAHAYFNAPHDDSCPLMKPTMNRDERFSKETLTKILKKIATKDEGDNERKAS